MLRAELVKTRTTRATFGLLMGAAVTVAIITALTILSQRADQVARPLADQLFFLLSAMVVATFSLILGARTFTDEFRHGTIVPTLTLTPRRGKVLAAKLAVSVLLGGLVGLAASGVMVGVMNALGGVRGATPAIDDASIGGVAGLIAAAALWGAVGAGLGGAVRSQVAVLVSTIVWIVVVENLATGFVGAAAAYLPGRAGYALAAAGAGRDLLAVPIAALVLVSYVAIASILAALFLRRDI